MRDAAMPCLEDLPRSSATTAQLDGDDVLFAERLSARDVVINQGRIQLSTSPQTPL
ncbi:hypothetical protein [Amycolatopsis sp. NBC_01286]|uniref:hypothetical protein n=1 Tax=Amycolatopsis sp. NBC_01286 TaxID=2903560 RepID=UPI002E155A05|nr:hypothetical protein OG570_21820 [Amycolatopsis sp. NBC_01286]